MTHDDELAKYLHDAPAMRKARQRAAEREALELRYLYDAPDKDDTQEIIVPQPIKVNVWWRLRLAQVARRLFGK